MPNDMGTFRVDMELENPAKPGVKRTLRSVLVDTGAELSWVPTEVLESLGVERNNQWRFRQANGTVLERWTGTVPRFSWASGCRVQSLTVSAGSACGAQFYCWQIESIQQNGISSPVRYAAAPSSATEVLAPVPLQAGQQYLVSIDHYDGGLRLGVASASFTP